jgi:hypothetical protein
MRESRPRRLFCGPCSGSGLIRQGALCPHCEGAGYLRRLSLFVAIVDCRQIPPSDEFLHGSQGESAGPDSATSEGSERLNGG